MYSYQERISNQIWHHTPLIYHSLSFQHDKEPLKWSSSIFSAQDTLVQPMQTPQTECKYQTTHAILTTYA